MAARTVNIQEARTHLSRLLREFEAGAIDAYDVRRTLHPS